MAVPVFSAYLGHACGLDTYWHLSACPELMQEAARRLDGARRHIEREQSWPAPFGAKPIKNLRHRWLVLRFSDLLSITP